MKAGISGKFHLAGNFSWQKNHANGNHFFPRYKNNPDLKDALMFSSIYKSSSVLGT